MADNFPARFLIVDTLRVTYSLFFIIEIIILFIKFLKFLSVAMKNTVETVAITIITIIALTARLKKELELIFILSTIIDDITDEMSIINKSLPYFIKYSPKASLKPRLYRKYGFQEHTIRIRLMRTPESIPSSPKIYPRMIDNPILRLASTIGAHTSW